MELLTSTPKAIWRRLGGASLASSLSDAPPSALSELIKLLLCAVFALVMVYHYVMPLGAIQSTRWEERNDALHMIWTLWIVNESITRGDNPYYTNLIYYPARVSLIYHTLAPGYFPVTLLTRLFSDGDFRYPIYAYRIVIWLAFSLLLYFSYRLLRELQLTRWASIIAAVGFSFCDFFMLHAIHIHHLAAFFIPLTALIAVRWYRNPRGRNVLLLALAMSLAIYFTELSLFTYLAAILFLLVLLLFSDEREALKSRLRQSGLRLIVASLLLFTLIVMPFVTTLRKEKIVKPTYLESSYYSANLAGFFIPDPATTHLYGNAFAGLNSRISTGSRGYEVFIGFPLLIFALVGLITRERVIRVSALLSFIFLLLSLGPTLKLFGSDTGIPLPYTLLMRVPPFDIGRTPVRFFVIGFFFLMIVAAYGISKAQQRLARSSFKRWSSPVMLLLLGWTLAEAYSPISRQPRFEVPPGLERISGPVLNLPVYSHDGYASLLQTLHHQPIGAGYLSRTTPERLDRLAKLRRLFSKGGPEFCEEVMKMGFRNLLISPDEMVARDERSSLIPLELSQCVLNVVDLRNERDGSYDEGVERPRQFPELSFGKSIDFRKPESDKFLWYGWSGKEPSFRWTNRGKAAIVLSLKEIKPSALLIRMMPFVARGKLDAQRVCITVNGEQIASLTLSQAVSENYTFNLPVLRKENVIEFTLPDADSPAHLGEGIDERVLGITVDWMKLEPKNPA